MAAKETFDRTLDRAFAMVKLHNELVAVRAGGTDPGPDVSDLLRMSLVLGVSALDAYYTDRFADAVVPHIKQHGAGEKLSTLLEEAGLDVKEALSLTRMDRPYRRVRTLVEHHLEKIVTQRLDRIDDLYHCLGLPKLTANAARQARRVQLCKNVENAVLRRHAIVHEGDLNNHGHLTPIKSKWTEHRLKCIQMLVVHSEAIIAASLT